MPNVAGKVADMTDTASPIYIAGLLISIGGIFHCLAGFTKSKSQKSDDAPMIEVTSPPKEMKKTKTVETVS